MTEVLDIQTIGRTRLLTLNRPERRNALNRALNDALAEAVIDAGAVRFRPMALTAAAVVVGSAVILFDPIFQGLAISLMAGEVASLVLSRVAVPVMYYLSCVRSGKVAPAPASDAAVC